jgi:hypothetical protein
MHRPGDVVVGRAAIAAGGPLMDRANGNFCATADFDGSSWPNMLAFVRAVLNNNVGPSWVWLVV